MHILVAIDFSDATDRILEHVEKFAVCLAARVWVIHVAEPNPDFVGYEVDPVSMRDVIAKRYHKEHQAIQAIASTLREAGIEAQGLLVQGATIETLLHEANKLAASLIMMGSHGHGATYQFVMGSVSQGVVKGAACPVTLIPVRHRA